MLIINPYKKQCFFPKDYLFNGLWTPRGFGVFAFKCHMFSYPHTTLASSKLQAAESMERGNDGVLGSSTQGSTVRGGVQWCGSRGVLGWLEMFFLFLFTPLKMKHGT